MTKSKNANKKFNWKKIASGVFNLKRAHVTISVVLKIPGKDTIQQSYQALEKKRRKIF